MKKGVDHIGVTCVFYCHDGKGNLLLHKRSENCRDEKGKWDCGGGAMELGETFAETVRREVREEYGVNAQDIKLVGVNNLLRKNGQEKTHWVAIIFAVRVNPQWVKIGVSSKMEQIGWFNTNKLPKPQHSMLKRHLEFVRQAGIL